MPEIQTAFDAYHPSETFTQTMVSGSTSGTAVFCQVAQRVWEKRVVIYCAALTGTASYTYPVAFTNVPAIIATNGPAAAVVTTNNTTTVTITGSNTTGFVILEGF